MLSRWLRWTNEGEVYNTPQKSEDCVDEEVVVVVRWEGVVEYNRVDGVGIVGMRLPWRYGFERRWDGQFSDCNEEEGEGDGVLR